MMCNCSFRNRIHDYACILTPKCQECKTRLDFQTQHSHNCSFARRCQHCNVCLETHSAMHYPDCPTNIRCEFCNIIENIQGNFHYITCPKSKFRKPLLESSQCAPHPDGCSICYDEQEGKQFSKTKCGHCFHTECLNLWLRKNNSCPTCRFSN